jgi:hypothetical protein
MANVENELSGTIVSSSTTKSSRHSKITGDFAEMLVLYWLSKSGYECAKIDHTGIDLIAARAGSPRMGISVQGRSRLAGQEKDSVNLHQFEKAREACRPFDCAPYVAIVVDRLDLICCYLMPLDHLETIAGGKATRTWAMSDDFLSARRADPQIQWFELKLHGSRW